ncbi:MAG: phosphotransferase [Oscillospiraceae bacterium]|jgi:hypothetical protein|nr:phosphotransferase [Oscillospiraceae bacterium]
MNIKDRIILKKRDDVQISLVRDFGGNKFIEKMKPHYPFGNTFHGCDFCELEKIESIIKPLGIPHPRIIESSKDDKNTTFIMEFIDGINCEDEPKAVHLYIAAEKLGEIYKKSIKYMNRLDKAIVEKYSITRKVILGYIKVIRQHYDLPPTDAIIDYIFNKYQNRAPFVNHGDMQFKNFICNDDLRLIDWDDSSISPFNRDLCTLMWQANEIGADINEIKNRYYESAKINDIAEEEFHIAGVIEEIIMLHIIITINESDEWAEDTYNNLQGLLKDFSYHK